MWWLEDILHEIGTVGLGAFFVFGGGVLLGRFLCEKFSLPMFRGASFVIGVVVFLFLFFLLIPDEFEFWLVMEIFLIVFVWGALIGFEKRWIWKELLSRRFWFPVNGKGVTIPIFFRRSEKCR